MLLKPNYGIPANRPMGRRGHGMAPRVVGIMKKGGKVKETGLYKLHKGEKVLSKGTAQRMKDRAGGC